MGNRGRPRKPGREFRPRLHIPDDAYPAVARLSPEELSAALAYIAPRWPLAVTGNQGAASVLVRPEKPRTTEPARLWAQDRKVYALLDQKNEAFKTVVKNLGLRWRSGSWERDLPERAGSPVDRLAELATRLLEARFSVRVPDEALADRVMRGDWEREHRRWVVAVKDGRVGLSWEFGVERVWRDARGLPDAEYDGNTQMVLVRPWHFPDLRDFAAQHGFHFTEDAEARLRSVEEEFRQGLLFIPKEKRPAQLPEVQPAPRDEEVTVPDDLLAD